MVAIWMGIFIAMVSSCDSNKTILYEVFLLFYDVLILMFK